MCCLFGFYNYSGNAIKNISNLTNSLAGQAIVRGKDASGIAYNDKNRLIIHKESRSADKIDFKHPDDVISVLCHTRHSTQGSHKKNYNNHPFLGSCKNLRFALIHNGVLVNDDKLQREFKLPKTKVETDSYVAVQLLEMKKYLNADTIKFMSENVRGSYSFSILDSDNTLWLIKGDSPLSILCFPKYQLYVYASTDEILYKALVDTSLLKEIKKGDFDEVPITEGDILSITTDGTLAYDKFDYNDYSSYGYCRWWDYGTKRESKKDNTYLEDLKMVATYNGISPDEIDELLNYGLSLEEIEDYIYCME